MAEHTLANVMQARTPEIGELVEQCARGQIDFDQLCLAVSRMGFKTTSLFEMVCAAEDALSQGEGDAT